MQVVHNGNDALAAAKSFIPDIIFVDILLPGMNGYDVAIALRKNAGTRTASTLPDGIDPDGRVMNAACGPVPRASMNTSPSRSTTPPFNGLITLARR